MTIPSEHALVERKGAMPVSPERNRAAPSTLTVRMPNGITPKLESLGNDVSQLSAMIEAPGRWFSPSSTTIVVRRLPYVRVALNLVALHSRPCVKGDMVSILIPQRGRYAVTNCVRKCQPVT